MVHKNGEISLFILESVDKHPTDIVSLVSRKFSISRQRAHTYVKREINGGNVIQVGKTKSTQYFLVGGSRVAIPLKLKEPIDESKIWTKYVKAMLLKYPNNIYKICNYGFTEILNNAIEHSQGSEVFIMVEIKKDTITMSIFDDGIGIFKKIQKALKLDSPRESVLHLSKGKFTTDPKHHSGQGIFFTSRIFDTFSLMSNNLYYAYKDKDWILSNEKEKKVHEGTIVTMQISIKSEKTAKEIMDQYSGVDSGFTKTIVAVRLSEDPGDPHVSRSQAKRLMMGLEKFREIVLDFKGVESAGQAFVDEVFRVFQNEYPNINITYLNANQEVDSMIKRGLADIDYSNK